MDPKGQNSHLKKRLTRSSRSRRVLPKRTPRRLQFSYIKRIRDLPPQLERGQLERGQVEGKEYIAEIQSIIDDQGINGKNENGDTPLHIAVVEQPQVIPQLLADGADTEIENESYQTPLHIAVITNNARATKILIEGGADVNSKDIDGNTPLHYVALHDKKKVFFEILVVDSLDFNSKNNEGNTPLHIAIQNNNLGIVFYLIQDGADINEKNNQNNTPLHLAVLNNNINVVEQLLQNGANIDIKNADGQTPLDLAHGEIKIKLETFIDEIKLFNIEYLVYLNNLKFKSVDDIVEQEDNTIIATTKQHGVVVFENAKRIGRGYNADVYCCSTIDGIKVILKWGNNPKSLLIEYLVYLDLLKISFPVAPVIDIGGIDLLNDKTRAKLKIPPGVFTSSFIIRPFYPAEMFGDKIIKPGLNEEQTKNLRELWFKANEYALVTGVPLDLKPDNLVWDNSNKEWILVNTGPRLDKDDRHKYAYTLDPFDFEEYFEVYWSEPMQGEGDIQALVTLTSSNVTIGDIPLIDFSQFSSRYFAFYQSRLKELQMQALESIHENIIAIFKVILKGIKPNKEVTKAARSNIQFLEAICEQHSALGYCPTQKMRKTIVQVDEIKRLRNETNRYIKTLDKKAEQVIKDYTGALYRDMNSCLRFSADKLLCREYIKDRVIQMNKILTNPKAPKLQTPVTVYRGIDPSSNNEAKKVMEALHAMGIGDVWEDRAFVSTSVQYPPKDFVGKSCCIFEILLPAGTPAFYIGRKSYFSNEEEILLLPGIGMRLVAKNLGDKGILFNKRRVDTFVFDCEYCLPHKRFASSLPPIEFNIEDIERLPYQPVDSVVGINRLGLFHLVAANKYIQKKKPSVLRFVTWNVHEWRNKHNNNTKSAIVKVLKDLDPDIIGLQEVTGPLYESDTLRGECEADMGNSGRLRNSLLISKKLPISSDPKFETIELGHSRCAVAAEFTIFGAILVVIVVHFAVESQAHRRDNFNALYDYIKKVQKRTHNIILMGDFNSYDRTDYNDEQYNDLELIKGKLPQGMDIFQTMESFEALNFTDVYSAIISNAFEEVIRDKEYSYFDHKEYKKLLNKTYKQLQNKVIPKNTNRYGGRIDFILYDMDMDERFSIANVYVYYGEQSDHIPVILDLDI